MSTTPTNLEAVFTPIIEKAGFHLVRLRLMGGNNRVLQVMAERDDGGMDVEGCALLSHALLDFIEQDDPIGGDYTVEVSSPGIDRPLTRPVDFARWSGHEARIELNAPIDTAQGPRKRFRAILKGSDGQNIVINTGKDTLTFPFAALAQAKLVLTDKLIAENSRPHAGVPTSGED